MSRKDDAADIFRAALEAADPYRAVTAYLERVLSTRETLGWNQVTALAFGKAAAPMMKAVADCRELPLTRALVLTKRGHAQTADLPDPIEVHEAGHPLPDLDGVVATRKLLDAVKSADEHTLVLCLVSGGGSALLVAPCDGISLAEKQGVTEALLKAGADIGELNTVRKHLSAVKGGRLAQLGHPAALVSLVLSDVIGDPLDVIASGPTAPDQTTYAQAVDVLVKYRLWHSLPPGVRSVLEEGRRGLRAETPKRGAPVFARVENVIVGSNTTALQAAVRRARDLGYAASSAPEPLWGEARDAGRRLARAALCGELGPRGETCCFVAGGETTVTVKGTGLGGRNTELALAAALELAGADGITLLSAGTDGTDGPTDAAGAVVDGRTVPEALAQGLSPERSLDDNDSYRFFAAAGGLFVTGPTGTNVMDLQVVLLDEDSTQLEPACPRAQDFSCRAGSSGFVVPTPWLNSRVTLADIEGAARAPDLIQPQDNPEWRRFKELLGPGDELWYFCSPFESFLSPAGKMGYVLVRDGKQVESFVALMN